MYTLTLLIGRVPATLGKQVTWRNKKTVGFLELGGNKNQLGGIIKTVGAASAIPVFICDFLLYTPSKIK